MATPHISSNFADSLDIRFEELFWNEYNEPEDMIGTIYNTPPTNGRNDIRWSQVGTVDDFSEFTGSVDYGSFNQGYDTVSTPKEFTKGIQAERKLVDDQQYQVLDGRPIGLAQAAFRTRQKHAARPFTNAFSVDTYFYNNTENVALCSASHTTTSGASTASGFSNLTTASLTATAVAAARIQFRGFRGDQAEVLSCVPDELLYPTDLYEEAYEIMASSGKVDTDLNNPNVHQGKYRGIEWQFLTDTNNWFMMDSRLRKRMLHWIDRTSLEFGFIEDFDTLVAKWRAYMRYSLAHTDWRWVLGSNVS